MGTAYRRVRSLTVAVRIGVLVSLCAGAQCGVDLGSLTGEPTNPFTDLAAIPLDGVERALTTTVAPLGSLAAGEVIEVRVTGDSVQAVLILAEDAASEETAVLAGGGPANEAFDYHVRVAGRYFVFVQFDPTATQRATIRVGPGDATAPAPGRQAVQIVFGDAFLSDPGLYDPESGTTEEQAFLASIGAEVRDGIVDRLRTIFADTAIDIVGPDDAAPAGPISRVTLVAARMPAADQQRLDTGLPPGGDERPECNERVIFGEVLPAGVGNLDVGNRVADDEAVVYVGSFQGRGEMCRSAAINSVNNIVLGLAQTAAHEIGHLVGLFHVPLTDVMNRSPTLAFQRELDLARGQVLVEVAGDADLEPTILTTVIQDPAFYFRANFGP